MRDVVNREFVWMVILFINFYDIDKRYILVGLY